WGGPHIYAQSLEDLFFAQGFVIAQDRLWQMELWRRWSEGRGQERCRKSWATRRVGAGRRACSSAARSSTDCSRSTAAG
ncbi:MAG: penicillin acylase family protein, partial [Kiloniellales bacterium]